jgi:DNA (cytosine-5)-methyltransferase 1
VAAYYNEIDPYAAQWLRNLIAAGHIAPGDVDERSIVDVKPDDLIGYSQCHFFAGIGGWSLALRLVGWTDNRSVWTGSCPCQPFSAAGAGKAADDKRHLWPAWFPLIAERRPPIVFGEQVEAAIGWGWLDAVFSDLEAAGYACGASVLPACGVGAPHIRNRLWFVADASGERAGWHPRNGTRSQAESNRERLEDGRDASDAFISRSATGDLADSDSSRQRQGWSSEAGSGRDTPRIEPTGLCAPGGMADTGHNERTARPSRSEYESEASISERIGGHWQASEWLPCTDGKARPVEPGTFPLAHGIPGRVGRLRAYGNAIVPQVAAEFIAAASVDRVRRPSHEGPIVKQT